MSIKVIGKDETAVRRVTCSGCASILEYTLSDLIDIDHSHDYLGDYSTDKGFKCPACGHNILVPRR